MRENWPFAFIGSFLLHLLLGAFIVTAPAIFKNTMKMDVVYTVKLFDVAPPQKKNKIVPPVKQPKPPREKKSPQEKAPSPPKAEQAEKAKKEVIEPKPKPKLPPQKKVSLKKPKREKKKVKKPKKDIDKLLASRLKKIEKEVRQKKREELLAKRLKAIAAAATAKEEEKKAQAQMEVLRLYSAAVMKKVQELWLPPVLDDDLMAVIVIKIDGSGKILKITVEKRSRNPIFDQSTLRAVQSADPLPPLPLALQPGPFEIGLRFRPGGIDSAGNQ